MIDKLLNVLIFIFYFLHLWFNNVVWLCETSIEKNSETDNVNGNITVIINNDFLNL